jgi:hypothetical protein
MLSSRINTIDLRLAGISNDILGLQTEQNRIKEYLLDRPSILSIESLLNFGRSYGS